MLSGVQFPSFSVAPQAPDNYWEDVRDLCKAYGLVLDPWQENVLRSSLGIKADGSWAASRVGLSVPRQSGKTALFEARELAGLLLFQEELIVHSAHLVPTALEGFQRIKGYFENYDDLGKRVRRIREANGEQSIEMMSGSRLLFKARKQGSGRGFSADCIMLDEAQILDERAWASMLPTMSARPNPQAWLAGTPPSPDDNAEVFSRMRDTAHSNKDRRLCWMEWSAPADSDPSDRMAWATANPGLGRRISADAIADEKHSMSPDTFRRERLGVWDSDSSNGVFDADEWAALEGDPPDEYRQSFGVKFSVDGARVSLATALRPEGEGPVFVEAQRPEPMSRGIAWLADWLAERWRDTASIVIDGKGGSLALASALRERGVKSKSIIVTPTTEQVIAAYAGLLDAVKNAAVVHSGQEGLASSVACAGRRDIGHAGGWGLTPITQDGDVGPTEAVALALYGAMTSKRRPGRKAQYDF